MLRVSSLLLALLAPLVAAAAPQSSAESSPQSEVVFPKHSVVTFRDDTVDGRLAQADATWIEGRARGESRLLIRIRRSFHERILQSLQQ